MSIASASTSDLPADLAPLVPRRSPVRNVILALVALLALAAVWLSPALLRPTLAAGSSGAGAGIEFAGEQLTVSRADAAALPSATLVRVGDVPGARAVAVWLIESPRELLDYPMEAQPTGPLDALRTAYPDVPLPDDGNLPRVFRTGQSLSIAIHWEILDCAELDNNAQPVATYRTALGTTVHTPLRYDANPASTLTGSPDALACMTR